MTKIEPGPLSGVLAGDTIAVDMHYTGMYRRAKVRLVTGDGSVLTDTGLRFDATGWRTDPPPGSDDCVAQRLDSVPAGARWIGPDREWARQRADAETA